MPISFSQFPANWRLPLYWVEVDPSMAGLPSSKQPVLLVGQKFESGSATSNLPIAIGTLAQAKDAFGEGSMLERMFASFLNNNLAHEMFGLPVDEPDPGAAATGTITVSTPPTDAGTIHLYIAGQHMQIGVVLGDTAASVAANIASTINDMGTLPVTAVNVSGAAVVTLTCKWKGATGNDIDMRDSYYGAFGGEKLPTSLTLTYSGSNKLTGGTGEPEFADAITALADEPYEYVAMPFTDSTSLLAWETEFGFSDAGRWGWMRAAYGLIFSAYRANYADMITWGGNNNSGIISFLGIEPGSPSPVWEWSAAYCGKAARALLNDPARPLQTLELTGILVPNRGARWNVTELNNFTLNGIATQRASPNGVPQILRETTSYQLNSYGQADDAYELVTTLATLAALLRNQKAAITSKFPRHKLADDGTRFGVGQAIVTPKIIKAELVSQYRVDEFNGLVENAKAFKKNLVVERDPNNPNRVNVLYPPDLVNQLRIFAVLAQFRLQFDRGVDLAIA